MAYTGNYIADLDETTPDGTVEKPHILDNALREIKRALKNMKLDHLNGIPSVLVNPGMYLRIKSDGSGFEVVDVDDTLEDLEDNKAPLVHSHAGTYATADHTHGAGGTVVSIVSEYATLGTGVTTGEMRITADAYQLWIWDGTAWHLPTNHNFIAWF